MCSTLLGSIEEVIVGLSHVAADVDPGVLVLLARRKRHHAGNLATTTPCSASTCLDRWISVIDPVSVLDRVLDSTCAPTARPGKSAVKDHAKRLRTGDANLTSLQGSRRITRQPPRRSHQSFKLRRVRTRLMRCATARADSCSISHQSNPGRRRLNHDDLPMLRMNYHVGKPTSSSSSRARRSLSGPFVLAARPELMANRHEAVALGSVTADDVVAASWRQCRSRRVRSHPGSATYRSSDDTPLSHVQVFVVTTGRATLRLCYGTIPIHSGEDWRLSEL